MTPHHDDLTPHNDLILTEDDMVSTAADDDTAVPALTDMSESCVTVASSHSEVDAILLHQLQIRAANTIAIHWLLLSERRFAGFDPTFDYRDSDLFDEYDDTFASYLEKAATSDTQRSFSVNEYSKVVSRVRSWYMFRSADPHYDFNCMSLTGMHGGLLHCYLVRESGISSAGRS